MPNRAPEDFTAEVETHLQIEIDRRIAEGLLPEDARAAAIKAFGSPTRSREQFYERSRWMWLDQFVQDLRYAWRGLRASPAFLVTTVATLAVGLSLLTVAFTAFNAYVLRPFAVADPSRLYRIAWRTPDVVGHAFPWREFEELGARTDLFDAVIAHEMRFVMSEGRVLAASYVSGNYFPVLRPRTLAGRALGPGDEGQPVAVLGERAWWRLFGTDPMTPGRTIDLDGRRVTVVGVMQEEFGGLDDFPRDIWMPAVRAAQRSPWLVARLRAGVTPAQAEAQLATFAARMAPPETPLGGARAVLVANATANPLSVELIAVLSPVFGAFALVLLAACFNVSNVMLSRAIARSREIAVRLSLGASRARLVRQLLTEGLLVAALAGAAAIALAAWLVRAGTVALFTTLPPLLASLLRVARMPLDYRVFLFAFAAAAAATLLFALLPALQVSRVPLAGALRGLQSGHRPAWRMRNGLVMAQVAVSVVLVVIALVLARNSGALGAMDLGYTTAHVYSLTIRGGGQHLIAPLAGAFANDPHLAKVVVTGGNPLFVTRLVPAGPGAGATATPTRYTFVSPEYMTMLQIPITRGRSFRPEEARSAARLAVVSESTARTFWPGADPIGRTIAIENAPPAGRMESIDGYTQVTVIGVVRDVVSGLMVEGQDNGHIYLPMAASDPHALALLFTPRDPERFRPATLRETFRQAGGDPESMEIVSLDEMRQMQTYPLRAASWVGALLGTIALVLSVAGLYGVLSYTLAQRTREIGIRIALGATAAGVVGLLMRQSGRLAAGGAAIGLAVSFAALKTLASIVELRQVSLLDPVPFAAAVLVVGCATAIAVYQPSRRAARINPADTLRTEA